MFRKVLVANRGAIACRIIRTLRRMGVGSVAVYSEADRHSLHVQEADEAVLIGPAPAAQSYLSIAAILNAAQATGAEAIHPGYGFLSENAEFAEACAERGIVFIGPTPEQIRAFGLKHTARRIAEQNNVALLPGSGLLATIEDAFAEAARVGYPVMLKSTAGGGGIGMRWCGSPEELSESYAAVARMSQASFGSAALYLEKFVSHARHIEVQIFGDGTGRVLALGERDCSVQRRNQKVIEETPAPGLDDAARKYLFDCAVRLGSAVQYESAGTVEFIYDNDTGKFYFLEVNTRLQVEHGVTEEVTGIDLVEWMVRQAAGEYPWGEVRTRGCSIEVRVYAEDPFNDFQPCAGRLTHVNWPLTARVETWVQSGSEVTPYYDPMLGKIIVHGTERAAALEILRGALANCGVSGIETNLEYLRQVCDDPVFAAGGVTTSFLKNFDDRSNAIDVVDPGTQTTIQDYPGREGYWHVGVPPSGPMDSLAFRLANRLVGNPESAAALEIAVTGPTLRFRSDAVIALTGADFGARLDGVAVPPWKSIAVKRGSLLELMSARGGGARAYLGVAGGFDAPRYLGSRSTFILGKFGGHAGRSLWAGDVLAISASYQREPRFLRADLIPQYRKDWEIGAMYGPHGAPDYFTPDDIEMFFSTSWKVHYNSDRTGVRLIGPKPVWARKDGGEAGLHPSNIHDNAYAIGTVDFTGDMPVILGPDGPSLGGFVCPATIVNAELWKIGQLTPGDTVRFRAVSLSQALAMEEQNDRAIETLSGALANLPEQPAREEPVLRRNAEVAFRADGDRYLLVEYGPMMLDLNLRIRVHALEAQLRAAQLPGIIDITAGVRSLQLHYDPRKLAREGLLLALDDCERRIPDLKDIVVPSRIVHLPLSWDDPATRLAIQKYMQSVRPDAPWCPSNIEFIRRINGLKSIDDVYRTVFAANYLVLGLGDVYLGAPVATPTDPRHRLVTTKYNPARTWTPENAVGIGGAYMCVYGMEGPGGYQFVGRTVQVWNTYANGRAGDVPYLLRNFDQVRFYPVSAGELLELREERRALRVEDQNFRLKEYQAFLISIDDEIANYKRRQQQAFLQERERWAASGVDKFVEWTDSKEAPPADEAVPEGCRAISSPVTASVWSIGVAPGERIETGQRLMVLEAMKMEIAVTAPVSGVVEKLHCSHGMLVSAGQRLVTIRRGDL
jgi:urea carboxylase